MSTAKILALLGVIAAITIAASAYFMSRNMNRNAAPGPGTPVAHIGRAAGDSICSSLITSAKLGAILGTEFKAPRRQGNGSLDIPWVDTTKSDTPGWLLTRTYDCFYDYVDESTHGVENFLRVRLIRSDKPDDLLRAYGNPGDNLEQLDYAVTNGSGDAQKEAFGKFAAFVIIRDSLNLFDRDFVKVWTVELGYANRAGLKGDFITAKHSIVAVTISNSSRQPGISQDTMRALMKTLEANAMAAGY